MFKVGTIFFLIFIANYIFAQDGIPFIRNYEPEEYKGPGQVWDVAQDGNGIMYFAADGVLEFDGTSWRKIRTSGERTVRSLDYDIYSKRIYVGGIGDFGYLEADSAGNRIYVSLLSLVDSSERIFFDVWKTNSCAEGVYFSTDEAVYRYIPKEGRVTILKDEHPFFLLFKAGGKLYTGLRGKGIVQIDGDSLIPICPGDRFKRELTWFMLPYGENKILMGNQVGGLSVFDPSGGQDSLFLFKEPYFDKAEIARTDSFLHQNQLYGGVQLKNGNYALATIRSGVIIVNRSGKIIDHINKEKGLQSQTVHYLFEDRQGALWTALTYGISRIEIDYPSRQWNKDLGIDGSIYNSIRFKDHIYCSSNLGLFRKQGDQFQPVRNLTGPDAIQVFALEKSKSREGDSILLASSTSGIYEIEGLIAKPAVRAVSYEMVITGHHPIQIIVSDDNALMIFQRNNTGKWHLKDTIIRTEDFSFSFNIDSKGTIGLISGDKPALIRKNVEGDYEYISFADAESVDGISFFGTCSTSSGLLFLSDSGLFQLNELKLDLVNAQLFNRDLEKRITQLKEVKPGLFWMSVNFDDRNYFMSAERKGSEFLVDSISLRRLPPFEEFRNDGDSVIWAISSKAVFRTRFISGREASISENTLLRSVTINGDSVIFNGARNESLGSNSDRSNIFAGAYSFDYNHNSITFRFALPSFDSDAKNAFRYSLSQNGDSGTWSAWSYETKKEYTNLSEGEYVFRVQGKNIHETISAYDEFSFRISPPWYRTGLMYVVYVLAFLLLMWGAIRYFTFRLKKKNQMLERIVKERTHEIWEQKEEIRQQAEELRTILEEIQFKNQEINQQNAEISAQRDNLEELMSSLEQRNEEISSQRDELLTQRNAIFEQKEQLERINSDLTDSIEYAHRLQTSAMPLMDNLKEYVSDYFVFFKPRDIVSGDFYWFTHLEGQTVITAADCTGHGVPGALMSILGMSLLKEIVAREYITHPGVILRKLRKGIIDALHQKKGTTEKDGMDVALISLDLDGNMVRFAGANNPLYIVRQNKFMKNSGGEIRASNDDNRLIEFKGDKMPVGIYEKMDKFNTIEIELMEGDELFLFSDGYVDQFGDIDEFGRHKKFKYKEFRKMLIDIYNEPMHRQKEILEERFDAWKGSLEQIDDVLIIGLKV